MRAVCHQSVSNGNTVTVDHFAAGSICPFALTEGTASKREERWEGAGGGGAERVEDMAKQPEQERKRALAES